MLVTQVTYHQGQEAFGQHWQNEKEDEHKFIISAS